MAWGVTGRLLASYGVRLLPLELARVLSLQSYLALVNLVVTGFGLLLSVMLLDRPWQTLGLTAPRPVALVRLLLATPAIYVVVSYAAVLIALPSLLAELRAQGVEGVRQSTGEFGDQVLHSSVVLALLWAVLIAPAAEELWFRGALWKLIAEALARFWPARAGNVEPPSLPEGVLQPSPLLELLRAIPRWFRDGGIATLLVALLFALAHADTPGGMGIVRMVSAAGLGVACGTVRQATGSTVAAFALHCVFNALSLATARRWVVTPTFPTRLMVPSLLSLLAVACLVLLTLLVVVSRKRPR